MRPRSILVLSLAVLLAACASVTRIEGRQVVRERLVVQVGDAWNKPSFPGQSLPFDAWTQEGLALDHLRLWAAIKDGQGLVPTPPSPPAGQKPLRLPTFRAAMPLDELVGLFELVYAADGSLVALQKVEPGRFAGEAGARFEFTVVRKSDNVQLRGVGWLAVRDRELYAATFVAPRLSFFERILPRAEAVVRSAVIQGR